MRVEHLRDNLHHQLERAQQLGLNLPTFDDIVHQRGRGVGYSPQRIINELRNAELMHVVHGNLERGTRLGMHMPSYLQLVHQQGIGRGMTPGSLATQVREGEIKYQERLTRITLTPQTSVFHENRTPQPAN